MMISDCCFISRLSATIAFAPPGPSNLAMVANRCTKRMNISFMVSRIGKKSPKYKAVQTVEFW